MDSGDLVKRLNADVPRLIGTTKVAEMLGVAPPNLDRVAGLPEPAQDDGHRRLWREDVIELFVRDRA